MIRVLCSREVSVNGPIRDRGQIFKEIFSYYQYKAAGLVIFIIEGLVRYYIFGLRPKDV